MTEVVLPDESRPDSLSDTLQLLRSRGVAAPLSCRIARGISHAAAVSAINGLAKEILRSRGNGTGLRVEPDRTDEAKFAFYDAGTACSESDSDSEEEGELTVWIGSSGWLERCVSLALRSSESGDVCVRHDPANGRIGMLLRRCPSIEVLLEQGASGMNFSAWLLGTPSPEVHSAPMKARLHLGDANGSELEMPTRPERTGWELPLLWQLNKIYCCPYSDGECTELQLPHGPAIRCYPLDDDDFDSWTKVEWDEADADAVAVSGDRRMSQTRGLNLLSLIDTVSPLRLGSCSSSKRLPAALRSAWRRQHRAAVRPAAPGALLWSTCQYCLSAGRCIRGSRTSAARCAPNGRARGKRRARGCRRTRDITKRSVGGN